MSNTLLAEEGVEGGFFRLENGALGGYSFPTHEAPGPPKEMPVRERPTIEGLARSAATTGVEQNFRFQGQHDAVLFDAIPLRASDAVGSPVIGSAWFMERLPGEEAVQHRQLLWAAFGFAAMALLICAAAYVILSKVRGGLRNVSTRLAGVVSGAEIPACKITTLEEFKNVLSGIDQMARDLQEKIQRQRTLEAQMAHQERLAAVGQFAAGIAHELRNPLATIRLRTQMSQPANSDGITATNARVVLTEIDRLNAMIEKLLHFARPVQRHETLLDLAAVARDRVQRWNEEYGSGSVRFHEHAQPVIVSGDGEEFRQVFDNLLENALQASATTSGAPMAEVSIGLCGTDVVVNILDHGSGFDEESLKKALQPFYTTKERGTGLGLAITSEIIRAHGGTLSLANREGGGGAVHFQIATHVPYASSEEGNHA
jgi:signal transduction histidine kinase